MKKYIHKETLLESEELDVNQETDEETTLDELYKQQFNDFLKLFADQASEIRDKLVTHLPAYNTMIELHAETFEQFALISIAKKNNINYKSARFNYDTIKPDCPECKSSKYVSKDIAAGAYVCNKHNIHFTATKGSIVSGTKVSSTRWMKVLDCLIEGFSVSRTCEYCDNMAINTYYNIRNRLAYAMEIMIRDDVKLYGLVQCDNAYQHISFKGTGLQDDTDYDYGMPYHSVAFIPRPPRKRGGSYSVKEFNKNSICIFLAVDNNGHCAVRYTGIGKPTAAKLAQAIPPSTYLLTIPKEDPFEFTLRAPTKDKYKGSKTLLVSDEEAAIKKYANDLGIKHEHHVFYRNGTYLTLPKGAHNIQRVNWLCSRLNVFLSNHGYVSSKYLPALLVLFEFIYNTGATTEAKGRLFEILATPGLGLGTTEDYSNRYITPNYILDWREKDDRFRKIPYNQLLGAYLYHLKHTAGESISNNDILEATGYRTMNPVKQAYNKIVSSGVLDELCEAMIGNVKVRKEKVVVQKPKKTIGDKNREICLKLYDKYCENLMLPIEQQRPKMELIFSEMNSMKAEIGYYTVMRHFKEIERLELRSIKLSDLEYQNTIKKNTTPHRKVAQEYLDILRYYLELQQDFVSKHNKKPSKFDLKVQTGIRFNKNPYTIANILSKVTHFPEYEEVLKEYGLDKQEKHV